MEWKAALRFEAQFIFVQRVASLGLLMILSGCAFGARDIEDLHVEPLALRPDTQLVVLLFHGRDRAGDPVWEDVAERFETLLTDPPGRVVVNYDWSDGSDMPGRAAANAALYGESLAEELAALDSLTHVHLVAHSAGSYLINDLCQVYRALAENPAFIEMTFLDPFGNMAVGSADGVGRRYGACADFASAYINTDDNVPTTNTYLADAHNFDVTGSAGRKDYSVSGHDWPVRYFLDVLDGDQVRPGARQHTQWPRGQVSAVD